MFIGHPQAGWRSAVIYSILISCRRRGLNPDEYLTDVLGRLPSTKDQPNPRAAPQPVETALGEYLLKGGSRFGMLLRWP